MSNRAAGCIAVMAFWSFAAAVVLTRGFAFLVLIAIIVSAAIYVAGSEFFGADHD